MMKSVQLVFKEKIWKILASEGTSIWTQARRTGTYLKLVLYYYAATPSNSTCVQVSEPCASVN